MQIYESFDSLSDNHGYFLGRKWLCSFPNISIKLPELHVFHEDVNPISELSDIVDMHKIRVTHYFEDLELSS